MSTFNFEEFSDVELRAKGDEVYSDLIDAANLCPNTPWHEACFAAMLVLCQEMQSRKMGPPTAQGVLQ